MTLMNLRPGFLSLHLNARSTRLAVHPGIFTLKFPARTYSLGISRPSAWSARIRFRPDGTPRRLPLRGVAIISLLCGLLYETWLMRKKYQGLAFDHSLVSALAQVQRVDSEEYHGVDFSSYRASLEYFIHLFETEFKISLPLNKFTPFLENAGRRDQAHAILREAAETVHACLAASKDEPDLTLVGAQVYAVLVSARVKLTKLSVDAFLELQGHQMPAKAAEVERVG
ncbi:hypothetical protein MSAN_01719100 [Mycena sanguinolenta]|uniref:Uncharacterized protein n=1 Tax=Mycena sanguinolenta TaxID=230812 RepID=A0A8H6XZL1_9AGAR|nr:hypothetical protein MSAN_01719100 [Mycena sanguinolenta]